jgi:hypothetical protein
MLLLLLVALGATDTLPATLPDTAQITAVSTLVGTEIDAAERRAFHLFPGYADFSSAAFYRMPDRTYAVELRTPSMSAGQRYTVAEEQFRRIGRYIDNFEAIVTELASLPDGESLYCDLWAGLGRVPERGRASPHGAPAQPEWADRIVNCATGAACGLGIGGTVGAATAIEFTQTRQESLLRRTCAGEEYWYHYSVDYYELDRGKYAALAGSGTAVGGAAGWLVGQSMDKRRIATAAARRGLAGYDFFGDPISEADVRTHMSPNQRTGWTFLGAASGFVVGTGVGLVLTSVARGLIFKPTVWDSIVVKNDGFSLDVPLFALSVAGLLKGAHLGYSRGLQLDWKDALEDNRRERLRLRR